MPTSLPDPDPSLARRKLGGFVRIRIQSLAALQDSGLLVLDLFSCVFRVFGRFDFDFGGELDLHYD